MWLGRGFDSDGDGENDLFVVTHIDSATRAMIGKTIAAVIVLLVFGLAVVHGALFTLDVASRASSFLWRHSATILWIGWGALIVFVLVLVFGALALDASERRSRSGEGTSRSLAEILGNFGVALISIPLLATVAVGLGFIFFGLCCVFSNVWDSFYSEEARKRNANAEYSRIARLIEITDSDAKVIAVRPGTLVLSSLQSLSWSAAEVLAQREGETTFPSLTALSDEAAKALAKHEGKLSLDGLTTLSVGTAKALAQHKSELTLRGVTTLSVAVANELAQHKGPLNLGGLTTLSVETAKALAQHEDKLSLDGVTAISLETARALAKHKGELHLDGLVARTFSLEMAQALAQHEGELHLNGLTTLHSGIAAALLANPKVWLPEKYREPR